MLALGIVAIILIAFGVFPQARVTRLIETRAKQALGEQSRIGRMRVVPARGEAEVWDSVIAGPGYRVELPRARFVFGLGALFGGELVIQKLELDQPRVVIDPVPGSGGAKGRPITVLDLRVTHGSLLYKNLAGGDLLLNDVSGSGGIGRGILELRAASGEWRRPVRVPLGPLHARVALTPRLAARLESLDASSGGSRIHLSGAIGALSDPQLDLAFEADVDLKDAQLFGGPSGTTGRVHTRGRISGSPRDLRVEAQGKSPRVDAGGFTLHALDADLELGGDTRKTLQLAVRIAASVNDQWGGVSRGNATISGGYTPGASRSELRWRAAVERRKAGTRGIGPGFVTAQAEGSAAGGTPLRIEGRMTGEVVSPTASGLRRVPFTGTFASLGRRIAADVDMRQAPGFLRASLDADAGAIKSLRLRGQDLDLLPLVGVGGRASLNAAFSGQPLRASGAAAVKAQGLAYRGASLGDAELRLSLRDGSGPWQLQLPALHARGDGELRLAGGGSLRGTLTLDRTPLQPLAAAFSPGQPQPLTGEVSVVADVTASLAEWRRAEVRLRASQLSLASGKLQARAGPFTALVRDGVADVQGLSIEVPGGRIEATGRLALGAGTNDLVLRVAADVQNIPNLAVPQGWQVQGRATGQLRLTGSYTRPWLVGNVQLVDMAVRRGQRIRIFELPKAELLAQGDRVLFTDVSAALAGGSVKASGELRLSTVAPALFPQGDLARPAQLQVEWRDVQAAVLSRAFGWRGDQVVEAALSGHFSVQGSRARLVDLSGHGVIAAVHGTAAGVPFDVDEVAVRVERGIATFESFTLRTGDETLRGQGSLDASTLALAGSLNGKVDLRALSALTSPAYLSGDAGVDVRLAGTLFDPRPSGRITLDRASARSPEFAQALTDMQGVLLLEPGLWRLEDVTGRFGGGDVLLAGSARPVGPSTWADVNFAITAKDVALRYPEDFKSRVSADLRLVGETGALQLQGGVLVDGGLYDKDIFLDQALRETDESLLRPPVSPLVEPLAPLRAVGLDIQARLVNPFLVRNNLAKLAVTGQIRVRGDLAEPAPYGRLEIAEGGLLFLQTRTLTVEGGSLIYEGTREPTLSVRAQGVIKQAGQEDVAVSVVASGPLERPHLALSSDPPYTEREIASLIATGRRNVALDSSAWVVGGEQVAALLAGRLTRNVQRGLLDLGLDEVDIQPELLARETNPGARFTFGKNIAPDMKLIVSRGLKDPESTFYQLEYRMRALYNVTARVQSDDHASITYGLGQRFRWGAPTKPKSEVLLEKRVTLKAVTFSGDKPLGEDVLRDAIKVKLGDDVTPWDIQDDADRLERLLVDAQYIEALVSARLEDDSAVFAISAGPRFRPEVGGMPSPPPLEDTLKQARFEGEALDRGRKLLLEDARARGYGRAKVDAAARDDPGWRTLSYKVELGAPTQVTVHFPGARALSTQQLISAAGGASEFLTTPQRARRLVAREYRAELYLSVRVGEPEVTESADHASVSIAVPVQEGPKAKIARVRFDGAHMPESVLAPLTGIAPGSDYAPDKVLRAVQQVREYYLKNGYAAVRLRHRLVPAAPDVELHFQINEGERDTIGPVVVTGLRRTRESLVRSRIDFKQGEPLDPRKLVELERRLMELGMFSRAAVSASGDNPRTIRVEVEERGPYMVNYDLRFSQDERATVLVDGEIGNLAGLGIVAGGRYRQGLALREARGSLVLPALGRARGITLSAFDREGDVGPTGEPRRKGSVGPFERRNERGAGVLHTLQLRNRWEAVYSYTLKRVGTTAGGGLEKNLGVLDASIIADGRDDPLNPTRGTFWSVNVGLSPKQLGSQLPFSRALGQVSLTLPVGRQLTWAQGYRVGVASVLRGKTLEEIRLIGRAEGFRAGGGSSVRGYATDSLGPKDLLPGTAAGDAVVIVNQELRYQLPAGFGAAVFYDAGNVFARYEDLDLKLRHAVGVGVRYLSPFGLVRVDVGFPVGRRPGEKVQIFLSLGQAF